MTTAQPPATLPAMPLKPSQIIAGSPTARGKVLMQTPDKLVSAGHWSCDVGEFEWLFEWDEFVYLLEGEALVTEQPLGITHALTAGQSASFARGAVTHWRIVKPVRKFFVVRTPQPLA